jgi:hypothetical protein
MKMYKLIKNIQGQISGVQHQVGNVLYSIPFDPANTDYQAFLKYQAEGGKVYGADEEVPDGQTNQ